MSFNGYTGTEQLIEREFELFDFFGDFHFEEDIFVKQLVMKFEFNNLKIPEIFETSIKLWPSGDLGKLYWESEWLLHYLELRMHHLTRLLNIITEIYRLQTPATSDPSHSHPIPKLYVVCEDSRTVTTVAVSQLIHECSYSRPLPPFIEISSTQGITARFLPLGATLTSLFVKDRHSNPVDVVLGFDDVKSYQQDVAYIGRTVGRVCNRIGSGRFIFDGKPYELPINNPPHNLHSGPKGIALKTWEVVRQTPTSVTFRMWASEKEDGLPGDAKIDVTYTVNDRNQLVVEHGATCNSPGVLNLTNHSYWNLDGSESVRDHLLHVDADNYLPTDNHGYPTGKICPVAGTKFDFNKEKSLRSICDDDGNIDIDNDMVLSTETHPARTLSLFSPVSGIKMQVTTSYPVIHLYGSKYLNCKGKQGEHYGSGKGLAIEAQFHTAAVNYPHFPSIRITPEKPYLQEIVYSFSTESSLSQ